MVILSALENGSDAAEQERAQRVMQEIEQCRDALQAVLDERCEHVRELHLRRWQLTRIAHLYGFTVERARQIVAGTTRTDADDGEGVA